MNRQHIWYVGTVISDCAKPIKRDFEAWLEKFVIAPQIIKIYVHFE